MDASPCSEFNAPKYRRVLLKISGESLGHPTKGGISVDEALKVAREIVQIAKCGVQMAVVVGGGNILRGSQFSARGTIINEASAHYMGMLATVINALMMQELVESFGCETRVMTANRMETFAEMYIRRRALRHLEKNRVVILAGGTGNPFVTTDTAAALRGVELNADILLKATKVDGVYDSDPEKNPHAVRYDTLTYDRALADRLEVMDASAIDMCRKAKLPILVFDFQREGNIFRAIAGQPIGTLVHNESVTDSR